MKDHKHQNSHKETEDKKAEVITLSKSEHEALIEKANKADENWDKYLRVYAELDNSRRLWDRQKTELIKFGNFRILQEFVSILDEIEAAVKNSVNVDKHHADGLNMTLKKIQNILDKEGVKEIETKDKTFDPHVHEALAVEDNPALEDGLIVEVFQKGYLYEGKVLRPARVKINRNHQESEIKIEEEVQENKEEVKEEATENINDKNNETLNQ